MFPSDISTIHAATERHAIMELVIATNEDALQAASRQASILGYHAYPLTCSLRGEAIDVGRMFCSIAEGIVEGQTAFQLPCVVLTGGETTVTLSESNGKGGRNQETVLSFAIASSEGPLSTSVAKRGYTAALLSCGTDGTDGPTDATGAIAPFGALSRMDHICDARLALKGHDSYGFISTREVPIELVRTGPTGTNVMDIMALAVRRL